MGNKYKILKRILNNLESSTLPTAEPSDSGKFAKVDENGEYVLGTGGGGGIEPLFVTVTEEVVDGYTLYTVDKTAGEIIAAMPFVYERFTYGSAGPAGEDVYGFAPFSSNDVLSSYGHSETGYYFYNDMTRNIFFAATLDDYPSVRRQGAAGLTPK